MFYVCEKFCAGEAPHRGSVAYLNPFFFKRIHRTGRGKLRGSWHGHRVVIATMLSAETGGMTVDVFLQRLLFGRFHLLADGPVITCAKLPIFLLLDGRVILLSPFGNLSL